MPVGITVDAALFQPAPAMVHSIDAAGRLTDVSDDWLATLGYRRADVIGRPLTDFLTDTSAAYVRDVLVPELIEVGRCENVACQMVAQDGRIVDVLQTAVATHDAQGRLERSIAVTIDVTRWRALEQRLNLVDLRYQSIVETQQEMICRFDRDLTLTFVNASYAQAFDRRDLVGTSFLDLVPAKDHDLVRDAVDALRPAVPRTTEHEVLLPDGSNGWQQWTDLAISDEDGNIAEYQSVGRDITKIKHLEQSAREREAFLRDVFESLNDGIAVFDKDGRFITCNHYYLQLHDLSQELYTEGAYYADILRGGVKRRQYEVDERDVDEWIAARLAAFTSGAQTQEIRISGDRWLHEKSSRTSSGQVVLMSRDMTDRKRMEYRIRHLAMHDGLTTLPNRAAFDQELARARARRLRQDRTLALILLDIDNFKAINDAYGHKAGDDLLVLVGQRMRDAVRGHEFVARIGGDEFAIIAEGDVAKASFEPLLRRLDALIREPALDIAREPIFPTASMGYAVLGDDTDDTETLRLQADAALYNVKARGRRHWRRYVPGMGGGKTESLLFETEMRMALDRHELALEYQPIVQLDDGAVVGIEALLRWDHPSRGRLPASAFIDRLERTPLMIDVSAWVIERACADLRWLVDGDGFDGRLWINVDGQCLRWASFADCVIAALSRQTLDPRMLVLELTETASIEAADAAEVLATFSVLGITIAIDDFGTGFSSLSQLTKLPFGILKIDKSFLPAPGNDPRIDAVLESIIGICERFGLESTIEGIETHAHLEKARSFRYQLGQGYHIGHPLPRDHLASALRTWPAALHAAQASE